MSEPIKTREERLEEARVRSEKARDPLRREAFLLSQLKIPETWRGSVVHQAIQMLVVPYLQNNQAVAWDQVIRGALALAERQFQFSLHRRYREAPRYYFNWQEDSR